MSTRLLQTDNHLVMKLVPYHKHQFSYIKNSTLYVNGISFFSGKCSIAEKSKMASEIWLYILYQNIPSELLFTSKMVKQ